MSSLVSANYRELAATEVERVANDYANAWQDASIPQRQFELAVKDELENYRRGLPCLPFDALVKTLRKLPHGCGQAGLKLLDVGASGGYYSEVLQLAGFRFEYTGCDFSPTFQELAQRLYPEIAFDVADARDLPYADDSFPIVVNGAVLMHTLEYPAVISETARVASKYVIFHRTPILSDRPTTFFTKDAYGIRVLEIHFCEAELLQRFDDNGLGLLHTECVFWDRAAHFGHRTYFLRKISAMEREWERA